MDMELAACYYLEYKEHARVAAEINGFAKQLFIGPILVPLSIMKVALLELTLLLVFIATAVAPPPRQWFMNEKAAPIRKDGLQMFADADTTFNYTFCSK